MELNILYLCQNDFIFKYLKQFIDKNSLSLAFYELTENNYFDKKNIYNIISLLDEGGTICVKCEFHNISEVINICKQNNYGFDVVVFHSKFNTDKITTSDDNVIFFVLLYGGRGYEFRKNALNLVKIDGFDFLESAIRFLINFTKVNKPILLINNTCNYISHVKNLCRQVVCFADNPKFIELARNQAVFIKEV